MNILHIIPSLNKGGAERIVISIIKQFEKKKGTNLKLVYFEGKNEFAEENILTKAIKVNITLNISLFRKNKTNVSELQHIIQSFKPHIIHSHLYYAELVTSFCDFPKGTKWFSHIHGFSPQYSRKNTLKTNLIFQYERYLISKSNTSPVYIAVSEPIQEFLKIFFGIKKNTTLLINAINLDNFKPITKEEIGSTLISVGALVKNKNHIFLLEVLKELKNEFPCKLIIIGDGPEIKTLKKYAQENQLDTVFTGKQDNVSSQLNEADLYLHAAKKEAFGLTIIEAMACGKPAICLNGNGNATLIQNGVNGYLFNTEDIKEFKKHIIECLSNKILYKKLSLNAIETANDFGIDKFTDELSKIYNN